MWLGRGCVRNLYRGLRNVWRNRSRTVIVLGILSLAACLGLVMLAVEEGIGSQVRRLEQQVGTIIEVRPAGAYGMMAVTDTLLPPSMVEEIAAMDGVAQVSPYVVGRMSPLTGLRPGERGGRRLVFGVAPGGELTVMGGGQVEVTAGRNLEPEDAGRAVAVIGSRIAELEELDLGDEILIENRPFSVVGIHESGLRLAAMTVFIPYDVALDVFGLDGLSQIYVRADSIGYVDPLREALIARYGDTVDVIAQKDNLMARLEDSLASLTSASRLGLVLSLLAAGVVVFGTMFLVVRERAREIGILKAIGAGRRDILLQFGSEAVFLSLLGAIVGLGLFAVMGPALASTVQQVTAVQAPTALPRGIGEFGALPRPGAVPGGTQIFRAGMAMAIGTVEVTLTWALAARAILGGVALGLAGGLFPSLMAARLKPAEVIRRD